VIMSSQKIEHSSFTLLVAVLSFHRQKFQCYSCAVLGFLSLQGVLLIPKVAVLFRYIVAGHGV
jgi:hypothetical protein